MIPIDEAFESHLQNDVTTHCFAWIIRRKDQIVLGFCDHDCALYLDGVHCLPQSGLNGSEAGSQLGLAANTAQVEGALTADTLNDADIERGLYDGAIVETYMVNWSQPDQFALLRVSTIGQITRNGNRFFAELKSSAVQLDQIHGRRIKRNCDAQFGDQRCAKNKDDPAFSANAQVLAINGQELTVDGLGRFEAQWFEGGIVEWQSGQNNATHNLVVSHITTEEIVGDATQAIARLVLRDPTVFEIAVGDRFRIIVGCDKSFEQCREKFSNQLNFRGFPHLPGNDAAYAYVSGEGQLDGGALVP